MERPTMCSLPYKGIRGSNVDASLHYAARLIEAGSLPSLARRLTLCHRLWISVWPIQMRNSYRDSVTSTAERIGFF